MQKITRNWFFWPCFFGCRVPIQRYDWASGLINMSRAACARAQRASFGVLAARGRAGFSLRDENGATSCAVAAVGRCWVAAEWRARAPAPQFACTRTPALALNTSKSMIDEMVAFEEGPLPHIILLAHLYRRAGDEHPEAPCEAVYGCKHQARQDLGPSVTCWLLQSAASGRRAGRVASPDPVVLLQGQRQGAHISSSLYTVHLCPPWVVGVRGVQPGSTALRN